MRDLSFKIIFISLLTLTGFWSNEVLASSSSSATIHLPESGETEFSLDSIPDPNVLTVMTWNIEYFGGSGSDDRQVGNVIEVLKRVKPDLVAIQEIITDDVLDKIIAEIPAYGALYASYITQDQKLAWLYHKEALELQTATSIDQVDSTLSANANLLSDLRYFAAGRLPYYAEFILSKGDSDRSISVLNIHAKANTGDRLESYYRRLDMAELLRETIIRNEEDWQQVLLMGDYNDDLDVSIYNELSTPYMPFLTDEERFWPVTQTLTLQGLTSMPRYDDVIDHIIATRSMEEFSFIRDGDISVHRADQYITNYESTTSDHYPVIASFTFNEASTSTQQDKSGSGLPDEFTLNPAYPNPFNPMTTLSYSMKSPQLLEITVLDVMGRNIQTLFSGIASAGEQRITFDASDLTTGLYIIQFRGRSFVKTQSVTLIR